MECPVCQAEAAARPSANDNAKRIECPACGTFEVSARALEVLPTLDDHHKVQALQYARTTTLAGRFPFIHGLG